MFTQMLEKVAVQRGASSAVPELFWIGTLAISVEDKYVTERRKAIKQIYSIYTYIKYKVVFNLNLIKTIVDLDYSNLTIKITIYR